MRIAIASDHAAVGLKADLVAWLNELDHEVNDLGPQGIESVDYPDYGVALCGTGIGISIAANRHPACRAARVDEPLSARLAREHNDANVIAMGARLIGLEMAKACIETFLAAPFTGGRHSPRVQKLCHPHFHKEPA